MTRTTRHTVVDRSTTTGLVGLDPADVADDAATRAPAQAALARILASDPAEPASHAPRPAPRRGRWALAGAAVLAGGVFAAVNLDEGSPANAFASWTPTPVAAAPMVGDAAGAACRRSTADSIRSLPAVPGGAPMPTAADAAAARTILAETRGEWTLVVLAGRGIDMTCLSRAGEPGGPAAMVGGSLGVGDEVHLRPDGFFAGGPGIASTPEGSVSTLTGVVGKDVTGVEITTADGRRVTATIAGDRFAAWWPGAPVTDPTGPFETVTVTLTLRDGTVRRNLPASNVPSGPAEGVVSSSAGGGATVTGMVPAP